MEEISHWDKMRKYDPAEFPQTENMTDEFLPAPSNPLVIPWKKIVVGLAFLILLGYIGNDFLKDRVQNVRNEGIRQGVNQALVGIYNQVRQNGSFTITPNEQSSMILIEQIKFNGTDTPEN